MDTETQATTGLQGNSALVDSFLQHCEDREIEQAQKYQASDIRIQFPGGVEHSSLDSIFRSASSDYKWVRKRRTRYFEGRSGDDDTVVSMGFLYGIDHEDQPFDNVRYIDVFVIRAGLIIEQLVWNDLAKDGIGQPPREKRG